MAYVGEYNPAYVNEFFRNKKSMDSNNEREINILPLNMQNERVQNGEKPSNFKDNTVRTAKYTALNFLPKQLFIQFSKLANMFFLFVSALQLIPGLSSTGTTTTLAPLMLFVTLAIIREGYDDRKRHLRDRVENSNVIQRLIVSGNPENPHRWEVTTWEQLHVGDKILVIKNEYLPADLLLISSSGEEGECYVETSSLDGETNLKCKSSIKFIHELVQSPNQFGDFSGKQSLSA
jgi:magnesium-transporting ATPase (P-type)